MESWIVALIGVLVGYLLGRIDDFTAQLYAFYLTRLASKAAKQYLTKEVKGGTRSSKDTD